MSKLSLQVPATTANLGPGFDSIGCALNMYNKFDFDTDCSGLQITGCPKEFCGPDNLVYLGYLSALKKIGVDNKNIAINIKSEIPITRGLGSSSSLLVAGVMAANFLYDGNLTNEEILNIAIEYEGHADNLSPAIFGGLTVSFVRENGTFVRKFEIDKDWNFITLVPDFALETAVARKALPEKVNLSDAIYNISHATLLLKAFETGDEDLLFESMNDKLHQDYRKNLIPGFDDFKSFSQDNHIPFCISGAGSTLMFVTKSHDRVSSIRDFINKNYSLNWTLHNLKVDVDGAKVL